jgi:hypothetical protein
VLEEKRRKTRPFCTISHYFVDTLIAESYPSQQDELRNLVLGKNRKSNEQKVRSIAGEQLWKLVETMVLEAQESSKIPIKFGSSAKKSTVGKMKDALGLERKTKIENKSDQSIKLIISYQPMTVTVRTKVEAGVSVPIISVEATAGREHEIQKGEHPPQEAVLLPGSRETFELPWKNYYLTIFTQRMDGACVIHEKNILVRSYQNWEFVQNDLKKQVEIKRPPIPTPSPDEPPQETKKKKKWGLW